MLELRLSQGSVLKKVLEAIKDMINECNFDFSSAGFSLEAIDAGHIVLVAMLLHSDAFQHYRCDQNMSLGINVNSLSKFLKFAENDDIVTIKADDGGDTVTFIFETPAQDKISDMEMKLTDIQSEHLGVPDMEYPALVRMPSQEFGRICRALSCVGDTVVIAVAKECVKFSTLGDIGIGNVVCRHNTSCEKPEEAIIIEMQQPIAMPFPLRYLNAFTKATPLSNVVTISISPEMPMVVEYKIAKMGFIKFYLAPKIEEGIDEC